MLTRLFEPPPPPPPQVRDRANLYLHQLEAAAPDTPAGVDPAWRVPSRGLEAALQQYLDGGDMAEPFDLVRAANVHAGCG